MKEKRPWFQIHLSTAVVLMFAAGGLMWANSTKYFVFTSRDDHQVGCRGWPITMWWSDPSIINPKGSENDYEPVFSFLNASLNALVAIAILLAICFRCERRLKMSPYAEVILLITMVGIVAVNFFYLESDPIGRKGDSYIQFESTANLGWPQRALRVWHYKETDLKDLKHIRNEYFAYYWNPYSLITDIAVALGIVFTVWLACEWWIRRNGK